MINFENKTYLVLGASSGIGKEVCVQISQNNGKFIAVARREDKLKELVAQNLKHISNEYIVADFSDMASIKNLTENLSQTIDGIVYCVGIADYMPVKFIKPEVWNNIINVNLNGFVWLMQGLLKRKRLNKYASIVAVSSINGGISSSVGGSMYAASKGALTALVKPMALELAPQHIRVNAISPGMVKTELVDDMLKKLTPEQLEKDEKEYPLGYGTPTDIAKPILFLLSGASNWMTGSNLIIDGGYTCK